MSFELLMAQPGTPRRRPLEIVEGSILVRPSWWLFRDGHRTLIFPVLSSRQELVRVTWRQPPPETSELRAGDRVALIGSWKDRVFRVKDVAASIWTFF